MTTGRLRTYVGIAPGVGKTYAMLRDGRARQRAGTDVVVAYWERHGREATAAQVTGLELVSPKAVSYRGGTFQELDVAAVLARGPALALVDELAHANVPGQSHEKRWEDIDELLANGIDVFTTLNVANIDSLAGIVSRVTGAHAAEPVPDVFVRAGEIKLVDLAPSVLRHRLAEGLVFPEERVDAALSSYYRFANLAALQEVVRLWLDASVADPVGAFLHAHGAVLPQPCDCVVVGLEGSSADEWLIRYAAQLAELSNAPVIGVHVRDVDNLGRPPIGRLDEDRRLLQELQGTLLELRADDTASGLVEAARTAGASQLVIGAGHRSRFSRASRKTVVAAILAAAGDLPVQVVNVGKPSTESTGKPRQRQLARRRPARRRA